MINPPCRITADLVQYMRETDKAEAEAEGFAQWLRDKAVDLAATGTPEGAGARIAEILDIGESLARALAALAIRVARDGHRYADDSRLYDALIAAVMEALEQRYDIGDYRREMEDTAGDAEYDRRRDEGTC